MDYKINQLNFSQNNFVELTEEEMSEINGGWVHLALGAGLGVVFAIGIYNGYKESGRK